MDPPRPTWRKLITHPRNLDCPTAQPVHGRGESEVCNAKTAILGSSERPASQASFRRPAAPGLMSGGVSGRIAGIFAAAPAGG
jgi:hypothetical protein